MRNRNASSKSTYWSFIASFCIPLAIMLLIYALNGVHPFGNRTVLTIDLGQQYIDFYADYRQNLFSNPMNLFYSFHKSLGGEMIGLWAYYLTSPFNLLFFLFPLSQLSLAVTVLTLLKISLAGTAFSFYLQKVFDGKPLWTVLFSTAYALMGYLMVYQLNLMWLDGIIFLPLIAYGLEQLLTVKKGAFYTFMLALTLFSNYYIGYMICLFLPLYAVFRLLGQPRSANWKIALIRFLKVTSLFLFHSLLAAGLSAILLLPTLHTLLESKAGYMTDTFLFKWSYPVQELLSKFVIGAFNFDQMPSGLPTVFVGSTALIAFLCYFFQPQFHLRERFFSFLLVSFLVVSMNIEALNKIWHAMQFPVWFPYRFAFLFAFFVLVNGYRAFSNGLELTSFSFIASIVLVIGAAIYLGVNLKQFDYLTIYQVLATCLIFLVLLLLLYYKERIFPFWTLLLVILTIGELGANAGITFSRLGHVRHDQYAYETEAIRAFSEEMKQTGTGFYRMEKTFLRSKNDSHQAQYNGVTHFSSTFEQTMPEFFKHLGLTAHNGFAVYANGTLFTDAFFGIRYYLNERNNSYQAAVDPSVPRLIQNPLEAPAEFEWDVVQTKPDIQSYPVIKQWEEVEARFNPSALPVAFGVADQIKTVETTNTKPIQLQNELFRSLTGKQSAQLLLSKEEMQTDLHNALSRGSVVNRKIKKQDPEKEAWVEYSFQPNGRDSYYLTFNSSIKKKSADLTLNGAPFQQYPTHYASLLLNVAAAENTKPVRFRMTLQKNSIETTGMSLYRLDHSLLDQTIKQLQDGGFSVHHQTNTKMTGTVQIQPDQSVLLFTLPYSSGWRAFIDGKETVPYEVLDSLMALDITPGDHTVEIRFVPPWIFEGVVTSLLSLLIFILLFYKEKNSKKRISD